MDQGNPVLFVGQGNPVLFVKIFFRLQLLNLDDTYKLGVLSFMHKYFYENLPASYHDMFNSLAEPNRTKSFPKIWNSIELELKETKSAKSFKRKVAKIYLDSYANYICKKNVYHVDKLSLYYLLHPVFHKHDFNKFYSLFQPLRGVSSLSLILLHLLLTVFLSYHHSYV